MPGAGNLQDDLVLNQDTLSHLGASLVVGSSTASTVGFGLSNSGGQLAVQAAPTAAGTLWLSGTGTIITNINISAGTTSNNLSALTISNAAHGISFGLNGSTLTASMFANISAGTTSTNVSAVTFSNSNGISFGVNGGTITAQNGGVSSWSNGPPGQSTFASSFAFMSLQPMILPYAFTVTQLNFLQSMSPAGTNASAGVVYSAGVYTFNGGATGSLSLLSSASHNFTWTSGAALSSTSGINIWQMTVASWALTPAPYIFAFCVGTTSNSNPTITFAAPWVGVSGVIGGFVPGSNLQSLLSNMAIQGFSVSSITALPASIGITNTSGYVRTGSQATQQPWVLMQGS